MKTQVLIIGAGPTGLMAANQLNRFGIDFLIIDSKSGPTEESRALSVSSRSMELYQQLDLVEKVQEQTANINGIVFYSNGKRKARVTLNDIGKGYSEFPHIMNAFEQCNNERLLNDNLIQHKKNVLWNYAFETAKENTDNVEVTIKNTTTNETEIITATYIIGCDGARSLIRNLFGFTFEGDTYENKFFVINTELSWDLGYDELVLSPSDKVMIAFFPMKGKNRFRIIGTLPKEFADKENIDFEALQKVIKEVTKFNINFENVNWHATYKLHHRCVDSFSKGRIFLAGDAAHIHSPVGGQGMNTGLQDGHNLAWKMALVLKGIAKPALLNTYNDERLPFAQTLLKTTDKGFSIMAGDSWLLRNFRKYILLSVIGKVTSIKKIQPFIFKTLSQIGYSYKKRSLAFSNTTQQLKFSKGDQLPRVETGYLNYFKEPVMHLLRISNSSISATELDNITTIFPFEIKIIQNPISDNWKAFGVTKDLYILVRPDHHIMYISDSLDKENIKQNLNKYFNF